MRILVFTNLFPSSADPNKGVFIVHRVRQYLRHGHQVEVVVPVPFFPFLRFWRGEPYSAKSVLSRDYEGMKVHYFRYLHVPRIGVAIQALSVAVFGARVLRKIGAGRRVDVIDAHYLYPDGVAATFLARWFRKPVVLSARGTDVNVLLDSRPTRGLILWALRRCTGIVAVSHALKEEICRHGIPPEHVAVVPNGVDREMFAPKAGPNARGERGGHPRRILMVGRLERFKGHEVLLRGLEILQASDPEFAIECALVGTGSNRGKVSRLLRRPGLRGRVQLVPAMTHSELADKYRSADVTCLMSRAEGCPNVVLESLACGTPVLATRVGDLAGLIRRGENGGILEHRTPQAVAEALAEMLARDWDPRVVSDSVKEYTWERTGEGMDRILRSAARADTKEGLRVLTYTTLFPNNVNPNHAVFVWERMRHVARHCRLRVVAPVPYFPRLNLNRKWYSYACIEHQEEREGIAVSHPRFFTTPKILMSLYAWFMYRSTLGAVERISREWPFDLIDAHYVYPDGLAAVMIARRLGKPVVITARGTDINQFPQFPTIRPQIVRALKAADGIIAVCRALKDEMVALGVPADKILVATNGVDAEKFHPIAMHTARTSLGLPGDRKIILSVGNLNERKGFHVTIRAMHLMQRGGGRLPLLVIVGDGEYRPVLENLRDELDLKGDVMLAGRQDHDSLATWYGACDVSCLASSREGWANVLLESMACGRPVVATRVWGTPEAIPTDEYGILVDRTPESLAEGLRDALGRTWDTRRISEYARSHDWPATARAVYGKFIEAIERHGGR